MAEVIIRRAGPEIEQIATATIDSHHEHLIEARILWLTTTSKRTRGGHVVLGTSSRSNPLQRFLTTYRHEANVPPADYVVLIDEGRWRRALATQRAALIDHLCCRMIQREHVNRRSGETTKTWATIGPDVEEFSDVIRRHGIWLPAQQIFARAVRETGQTMAIQFPDLDDDDEPEESTPKEPTIERETTVDADGVVTHTERVDYAPDQASPAAGDADDATLSDDTEVSHSDVVATESPRSDDAPPSSGPSTTTNGHIPDELDEAIPGWRSTTGIGSSEIEQHRRRRRGTASSEQPAEVSS